MELRSAWKPTPVATSREIFHGELRRTVDAITFIEPLESAEARGTQVVEIPMSDGLVFGAYFLGTHPCAARTAASGLLSHGSFSKLVRTVRVPEFSLQNSSRESPLPTGSFGIHVLRGHVIPLKRVRTAVAFQLDANGVHANGLEVGDVPLGRTQTIDFDRPFGFYVRTSARAVLFEGRYY